MKTYAPNLFLRATALAGVILSTAVGSAQDTTTAVLGSVKDNTIYGDGVETEGDTDESNGAGDRIFIGVTGMQAENPTSRRRALLVFDVAGSIPAGSTVQSATLTLTVTNAPTAISRASSLHRLSKDWGEEGSISGGLGGGEGGPAEPGDATWNENFFGTEAWSNAGGDFVATASATASVPSSGTVDWTGTQLTADVQDMLDNPGANFGWILIGDESTLKTARAFGSREHATAASRPKLVVEYIVPEPSDIEITAVRIDAGTFLATFTAGGNVDVYRSSGLQDFGAGPIATDVAPGTDVVLDSISLPKAFYVLVPADGPAP